MQKINDCNIHFGLTCANTLKRTKGIVLQKEKGYVESFHLIFFNATWDLLVCHFF
jgi:hypothetical protein